MKLPWAGKSGLAKAAAIFATLTLVSFGLCGVNLLAFATTSGHPGFGFGTASFFVLIATAYIETSGILVGLAGIVGVLVVSVVQEIRRRLRGRR